MQIDRKALDSLLGLNDRQLTMIINKLISESGIDPAQFNLDPSSVSSIRNAIAGATDDDLEQIVSQYQANKQGRGGKK